MSSPIRYYIPVTNGKSAPTPMFFHTTDLEDVKILVKCLTGDVGLEYLMSYNPETKEIAKVEFT